MRSFALRGHRRPGRALALAVSTTLLVGLVPTAGSAVAASGVAPLTPSARIQVVDCSAGFLKLAGPRNVATVANRVTCYRLPVVQDRTRPTGPLTPLSIAIAVIEPVGGATSPEPLLALGGGVSKGTAQLMSQFFGAPIGGVAQVERLAPGRRVIVVDSRGAGLSAPILQCDGVGFSNSLSFPTSAPVDACRASLAAAGLDPANFTAARFAEDLIQIRREFGITSWNVYGISYGSWIAMELLRRDGGAVRTLNMDGVSPPSESAYAPAFTINPILATFDDCRADAACGAAYPNLDAELAAVLQGLPNDPTFPDTRGLSRQRFIKALWSGVEFGLRGQIPAVVHAAAQGDFTGFTEFADTYDAFWPSATSDDEVDDRELTFLASVCTHETSPQRLRNFGGEQPYRRVAPVVVRSVSVEAPEAITICRGLGVKQGPDVEIRPVTSKVPTLMLNGVVDTATPLYWAQDASQRLRRAQSVSFPDTGHTPAIVWFDCAAELIADHVASPGQPVDPTCASSLPSTIWEL